MPFLKKIRNEYLKPYHFIQILNYVLENNKDFLQKCAGILESEQIRLSETSYITFL